MDDTITITLKTPIEDPVAKTRWEEITLKEPVLMQVEQFDERQKQAGSSIAATRLLIHLVSGVSETALKKMAISDFKKCDEWLNRFFTGKSA